MLYAQLKPPVVVMSSSLALGTSLSGFPGPPKPPTLVAILRTPAAPAVIRLRFPMTLRATLPNPGPA